MPGPTSLRTESLTPAPPAFYGHHSMVVHARGRLIALEGGEGCGKSTQVMHLAADLAGLVTREPGGTAVGRLIRGVLLDPAHEGLVARSEALLLAADRAQHAAEVVEPALAAGTHVVSDRSAYSSLAYQGFGRGLPIDEVRALNDWALAGRWPDLVLLLDLDLEVAATRITRDLDRIERAGDAFHQRVRAGYLQLAASDPERWVVLDADRSPDEVAFAVRAAVRERLGL